MSTVPGRHGAAGRRLALHQDGVRLRQRRDRQQAIAASSAGGRWSRPKAGVHRAANGGPALAVAALSMLSAISRAERNRLQPPSDHQRCDEPPTARTARRLPLVPRHHHALDGQRRVPPRQQRQLLLLLRHGGDLLRDDATACVDLLDGPRALRGGRGAAAAITARWRSRTASPSGCGSRGSAAARSATRSACSATTRTSRRPRAFRACLRRRAPRSARVPIPDAMRERSCEQIAV